MSNNIVEKFNPFEWLRQFRIASEKKEGFRELRAEIFQDTVKIVTQSSYNWKGSRITIDNEIVQKYSELYDSVPKLTPPLQKFATRFSVIEADCLETAQLMIQAGYRPCVLNMANRQNPGGGVLGGAGAQEENLFRRSNLFRSLYQYAPYATQYNVPKSDQSYPLNRNTGGCYSDHVTVFRGSERSGYCFLGKPYRISVVTVPAINRPDLEQVGEAFYITKPLIEPTKEKMRTILRIAGRHSHDGLVLGAFGCGAFRNPPNHVAALFKEVFQEPEFTDHFRLVVFAIINDHNSSMPHNPQGNLYPFLRVFDC